MVSLIDALCGDYDTISKAVPDCFFVARLLFFLKMLCSFPGDGSTPGHQGRIILPVSGNERNSARAKLSDPKTI